MDVCPAGAIRIGENGAAVVNEDLCIGCKQCLFACPFGAAGFDEVTGTAFKCDLCSGDPECVKECSTGALQYLDLDQAMMKKKRDYYMELTRKEVADGFSG